jgi:molecular chaperone DnaK
LNVKITRTQLEELVADLIERLEVPCLQAFEDAKLKPQEIDEVVLVGGMTRMPKVQDKVRSIFGKEPQKRINPDEVVAIGAGIQGGVLEGKVEEVLLLDVVPLSLGVETKGGLFTKIIERNTTIPTRRSRIFTTAIDNQDFVSVHVLQGEREMSGDNISLARFNLVGIPPAPRGMPQVEVSFEVDADGILHVFARDLGTGKKQAIQVFPSGGLSEEDIQKIIETGQNSIEEDRRRKELALLRNESEGLLYSVIKTLDAYGDKAEPGLRKLIEKAMERMKQALVGESYIETKEAFNELKEASYSFAEFIYSQQRAKSAEEVDE